MQCHDYCLLGPKKQFLWMWCWERRWSTPSPTSEHWKNSTFLVNLASHESVRILTPVWQCKAAHKCEDSAITKFGWTVLPHPSYSPDLAASNFHLFRDLKNVVCGTKFETNDDVIHVVRTWLHEQDKAWNQQGIYKRTCSMMAIKWPQNLWIKSNHHSSHCVIFMIYE